MPNFYVHVGEFRGYLFGVQEIRDRSVQSGTELAQEIPLTHWSTANKPV